MSKTLVPFTRTKRARRVELESLITQGFEHIQHKAADIGKWLQELRDGKLYEETHETWTEYLEDKEQWGWSRRRAYQLLTYADVLVCTSGSQTQPNERQARELAALPNGLQGPAWELLSENGKNPPATAVHDFVAEMETALENLPPELQQQAIEEAEERVIAAAAEEAEKPEKEKDPRAKTLARLVKLVRQCESEAKKLGAEARPILKRLQGVSVALCALPE